MSTFAANFAKGLSIYDVQFFGLFFDLPTHVRFCPNKWILFYLIVSDFRKPTYLPQNRTSYVDKWGKSKPCLHCQKNLCTFCFILYKFCVFLSLCLFFCNNFAFECCHIEYHSLPFKLKTFVNFCKKFAIEDLLFNTNAKELHLLIFEKIQKFCNILQKICD